MQKRTFPTFFLLCFFLLTQNVIGQEETSMRIHGSIGLSSMSGNSYGSGFWSGFGFSVLIKKDVHLSFNFGAWNSQVTATPDGLQSGTLTMSPFFISLHYFFGQKDRLIYPYLFIGGGYIFNSFRMEDVFTIPEITLSQKVDNSPGGQVGAGIQMKVSKRISLSADVSYLYNKANGTTTIQDLNFGTTAEDISLILSALIFQIGIKFFI